MPLFTYVMSHSGEVKVSQHRHGNFKGFKMQPIEETFPNLRSHFTALLRPEVELNPQSRFNPASIAANGPSCSPSLAIPAALRAASASGPSA